MTAYRQQALTVANALAGARWFARIERGLYGLTSSGRVALVTWADKFQPGDKRGFEAQRGLAR